MSWTAMAPGWLRLWALPSKRIEGLVGGGLLPGQSPQTVSSTPTTAGIAEAPQRSIDRVVGHRAVERAKRWKQEIAVFRVMFDLADDRYGLARKRNRMRPTHFHLVTGNCPDTRVEVELLPFRPAQLAGPNENMRKKLE